MKQGDLKHIKDPVLQVPEVQSKYISRVTPEPDIHGFSDLLAGTIIDDLSKVCKGAFINHIILNFERRQLKFLNAT